MIKARPYKLCLICPTQLTGKPSAILKKKFCSPECSQKHKTGENNPNWKGGEIKLLCQVCGKVFNDILANSKIRKHCSRECYTKASRGRYTAENSPAWKGGQKASLKRYLEKKKKEKQIIFNKILDTKLGITRTLLRKRLEKKKIRKILIKKTLQACPSPLQNM